MIIEGEQGQKKGSKGYKKQLQGRKKASGFENHDQLKTLYKNGDQSESINDK